MGRGTKSIAVAEDSLTVRILQDIREEARGTNRRLDQTREELVNRIDGISARIDQGNARLDKVEEVLRDLAAQLLILTRYVKNVVDRHDQAIDEIRAQVGELRERLARIEGERTGPG